MTGTYTLRELSVARGETIVLRGISGEISSGQVTVLIGPNGSGKSTLLRALAGGLPFDGKLSLYGKRLSEYSARERAHLVAFVRQEPLPPSRFTAGEVVLMGRLPYSSLSGYAPEDEAAALDAEKTLDVAHLSDRPLSELSGGERQRVAIAQAVAQGTDVLLLDEPSSSLDPRHASRLLRVLRDLACAGKTIVAAFHDLSLAGACADVVWALRSGGLVAAGGKDVVLSHDVLRRTFDARFVRHRGEGGHSWHVQPC